MGVDVRRVGRPLDHPAAPPDRQFEQQQNLSATRGVGRYFPNLGAGAPGVTSESPVTVATTGQLDTAETRDPRPVSTVTKDLERVAADVDLMYRSERPANPIALHDALHALHRAIVALDSATAESPEQTTLSS